MNEIAGWMLLGIPLLGLLLAVVVILFSVSRSSGNTTEANVRLSAIEQQQARTQQLLFEQLNKQQSNLTEILDKRLARNTDTVTQSILEYNKSTGKTLGDRSRTARQDRAGSRQHHQTFSECRQSPGSSFEPACSRSVRGNPDEGYCQQRAAVERL